MKIPPIPSDVRLAVSTESTDRQRHNALTKCYLWRLHAEKLLSAKDKTEANKYLSAAAKYFLLRVCGELVLDVAAYRAMQCAVHHRKGRK